MPQRYEFKIGATALVALEAVGATDAQVEMIEISAVLKLTSDGYTVPPLDTPAAATFACAFRAAADDVGPGWNLTINPTQTDFLTEGTYVTNAVLTLSDGTVQKTDPLFLSFAVATQ